MGRGIDTDAEGGRMARIHEQYRASARKQRAWAGDNPGNLAIRAQLTDALAGLILPTEGVVDVGCGSGWLLRALSAQGADAGTLTGFDVSEPRVAAARRALPHARFEVADARALPLPDRSVQRVVMVTLLSSMNGAADRIEALGEARRVLRPGGHVLVYEPWVASPFNRHTHTVRLHDARRAGLDVLSSRSITPAPMIARRLGRATRPLFGVLDAIPPLRTHRLIVLVAR